MQTIAMLVAIRRCLETISRLCVEKLGKGSMLIMGSYDKCMHGRIFKEYFEQNGLQPIDLFYDSQVFVK